MYKSVLQYLENTARKFPQKAAFQDNKKEITFAELVKISKQIGTGLSRIVSAQEPVVVYMRKSVENIPAFFGAVYAGCFYVPIDSSMPVERVQLILNCLKPKVLIYDESAGKNIDLLYGCGKCLLFGELVKVDIDQECLDIHRRAAKTTDILYTLFTSGSTGIPKGVTISHAAVIDFMEWICDKYQLDESRSLCSQAPFYFDASVPDIFIPLKTGATTYIPPKNYYTYPQKVLTYIREKRINTLIWVPSALCAVVHAKAFEVCIPDSVDLVIFCGEVMPCKYLNVWRKYLPAALFVNMYGPTEATYACMYYDVNREFGDNEKLPLGTACDNTEILLLKENNQIAEIGEIGEICILGQCLSSGYYADTEKTSKAFQQNPVRSSWNEIIYRTGDLAMIDDNGYMMFVGRKDSQIKRSGFRIELGEIENAVNSMNKVSMGCCLFEHKLNKIIVYYVGDVDRQELSAYIRARLPKYMLPDLYEKLESMPMNLNGKIDRVLLKERFISRMD